LRTAPLALFALGLAACTASPVADLQPGTRPALDTDEAGIWMAVDGIEERWRTSGHRLHDPALDAYLHRIACRLSPEHCQGLRVYVMEHPYFNAAMMPNGAMEVWTGTLLRVADESQLATVIGHELAHFERRHTLQQWRSIRSKATLSQVVNTVGGGLIGLATDVALRTSVLAFSREQEREADALGLARLPAAGYDARDGAEVWQLVVDEDRHIETPAAAVFLSTHPTPADRLASLQTLAADLPQPSARPAEGPGLAEVIAPHRLAWLEREIRRQEPAATAWLLDELFARGPADAQLHFARGELLRRSGSAGDREGAVAAYKASVELPDPPTEAWRSLGLMLDQLGRKDEARVALATYLREAPDAADAPLIATMIEGMP
jgi:predicted Zn-dependent protease